MINQKQTEVRLAQPPKKVRKVVFFGTPEVAVPTLKALVDAGFEIPLVITKPDVRRGRGTKLVASPVKVEAERLGIRVAYDPNDALEVDADLGVVVAYGKILRVDLLEALPLVNIHFSLLPKWRGAAPVERTILAGDATTGVCLMQIDRELDTGHIYSRLETGVLENESLNELRTRLVMMSSQHLVEVLTEGLPEPKPQVGEPSYANKIEKSELKLDFSLSAEQLSRVVRLGNAWCLFRGKRLRVNKAVPSQQVLKDNTLELGQIENTYVVTSDGQLALVEVQPEGKKSMLALDWLRGLKLKPGEKLE